MTGQTPLAYEVRKPVHRGAELAFWLSVASAAVFCTVVPPALMFIVSFFVWMDARRDPMRPGVGVALRAMQVSGLAAVVGLLVVMVMMPSFGGSGLSGRSVCASNLRGITQSMAVYAADNSDRFPVVQCAPYSAGLNDARAAAGVEKPSEMIALYYTTPYRQAGSPQAMVWQLVIDGDVSPKSFICMEGTTRATKTPAKDRDAAGRFYDNFQDGHQLDYSIAYPWKADGTVGAWWKNTTDANLPLMADMAPEQGTGSPVVDVTALTKESNSRSHKGDGQNVAFADAHVEFVRLPNVGHGGDDIYAWRPKGAAKEVPAEKVSPMLTAEKAPFDIVMYPIRNETTGGF